MQLRYYFYHFTIAKPSHLCESKLIRANEEYTYLSRPSESYLVDIHVHSKSSSGSRAVTTNNVYNSFRESYLGHICALNILLYNMLLYYILYNNVLNERLY